MSGRRPIFLCGFMGCGKSTVGKILAERLGLSYLDMDEVIEQRAGKRIPEIFAAFGETHFRDLEHETLNELCDRQDLVVSTGGGAMTFARNRNAVKGKAVVVFLDVNFERCYRRIAASDRPIVNANTPEQLKAIYDARLPAYRAAASMIVWGEQGAHHVAQNIQYLLPNR